MQYRKTLATFNRQRTEHTLNSEETAAVDRIAYISDFVQSSEPPYDSPPIFGSVKLGEGVKYLRGFSSMSRQDCMILNLRSGDTCFSNHALCFRKSPRLISQGPERAYRLRNERKTWYQSDFCTSFCSNSWSASGEFKASRRVLKTCQRIVEV
jgi:hypothetical protein